MRKLFSVWLCAVLLCALTLPVFAANPITNATENNGSAIVKTDTTSVGAGSFSVSIPADMTVIWGAQQSNFNYTVDSQLAVGKLLNVSVAPTAGVMRYNALELPYTLTGDTNFTTVAQVVTALKKTVAVNISAADWNTAAIAEYQDTVTFTATIIDA